MTLNFGPASTKSYERGGESSNASYNHAERWPMPAPTSRIRSGAIESTMSRTRRRMLIDQDVRSMWANCTPMDRATSDSVLEPRLGAAMSASSTSLRLGPSIWVDIPQCGFNPSFQSDSMKRGAVGEHRMDEVDDVEVEIIENVTVCPTCSEPCPHEVLRERPVGAGLDLLVRCGVCTTVHTVELRPPREVRIPFMLSDGPSTTNAIIPMDADEPLALGDAFEHQDRIWTITRLEDPAEQTHSSALAEQVARGVALRSDLLRVKVTLTEGEHSTPTTIEADPMEVFHADSMIEVQGRPWRIRAIHTGRGRTLNGSIPAHRIVRMYLHAPKADPGPAPPMTGRERRQAWKEGRLGHNPNPQPPTEPRSRPSRRR